MCHPRKALSTTINIMSSLAAGASVVASTVYSNYVIQDANQLASSDTKGDIINNAVNTSIYPADVLMLTQTLRLVSEIISYPTWTKLSLADKISMGLLIVSGLTTGAYSLSQSAGYSYVPFESVSNELAKGITAAISTTVFGVAHAVYKNARDRARNDYEPLNGPSLSIADYY